MHGFLSNEKIAYFLTLRTELNLKNVKNLQFNDDKNEMAYIKGLFNKVRKLRIFIIKTVAITSINLFN